MLVTVTSPRFVGVRLTGYPGILRTYNTTASQMRREVSKRNPQDVTISFGGPVNDPSHAGWGGRGRWISGHMQGLQPDWGSDAAHLRLRGCDVVKSCDKYKHRLVLWITRTLAGRRQRPMLFCRMARLKRRTPRKRNSSKTSTTWAMAASSSRVAIAFRKKYDICDGSLLTWTGPGMVPG